MFGTNFIRLAVVTAIVGVASVAAPVARGYHQSTTGEATYEGCASTACANIINVQRDVMRRVDTVLCVDYSHNGAYLYYTTTRTGHEFKVDGLCCGTNSQSDVPTSSAGDPCPIGTTVK